MMESVLRLFKGVLVESKQCKQDDDVLKQTLSRGFILSPEVISQYPNPTQLITLIDKMYGRSGEQLNQSFHKSWFKVRNASIEQLVLEQMLHYITTYGFEKLGIYSQDTMFIPKEQLDVPELQDDIRLIVIRGYTRREAKAKLMQMLTSGIALHQETIKDVLDVAGKVGLSNDDIERVRNKEVKIALYDALDRVPAVPTEFLRYMIYKATDKTLLIKDAATITAIKNRNNLDIIMYFDQYEKECGLERLAEIFYRFKPLFLAFRTNAALKTTINRIRRLAEHHPCLPIH